MNNYVLFSPVGDTDPVRNEHDGALLHIVRHYKPSKVYIYYTEAMAEKSEAIKKALEPFNIKIEEIYSGITNPSDYDVFVGVFDDLLIKIQDENPNSKILLNIASGTPQMKSALCLEVVTSHLDLKPIQVETPVKKSNKDIKHGGDIDNNYDSFMDNGEYLTPNRCLEVDILSFRKSSVKRDVISLVEHYEYRAAGEKLKENKNLFNSDVISLVEYAALRQNDNKEYHKSKWNEDFNYTKNENANAKLACDYYCILNNKAKTGELSYFVLLLKSLAEHIAKSYIGEFKDEEVFNCLNNYYKIKSKKRKTKNKYNPSYYKGEITYNLEQLIVIMEYKGKPKTITEKYLKLNKEIGKRNILAHTLSRIDDLNTSEILKIFKFLIKETYGNEIKENSLILYENINKEIIKML